MVAFIPMPCQRLLDGSSDYLAQTCDQTCKLILKNHFFFFMTGEGGREEVGINKFGNFENFFLVISYFKL